MTSLNVSKAREELPDVVNRAAHRKERTMDDLRPLERLAQEEMDRIDLEAARAALAEPGGNIPLEQIKNELGLSKTRRTSRGRARRKK